MASKTILRNKVPDQDANVELARENELIDSLSNSNVNRIAIRDTPAVAVVIASQVPTPAAELHARWQTSAFGVASSAIGPRTATIGSGVSASSASSSRSRIMEEAVVRGGSV